MPAILFNIKILFVSSRLKVINKPFIEVCSPFSSSALLDISRVFAFNLLAFSASMAFLTAARGKCFGNIAIIGTVIKSAKPRTIHPKYLEGLKMYKEVVASFITKI
jgi:hypothetical protein